MNKNFLWIGGLVVAIAAIWFLNPKVGTKTAPVEEVMEGAAVPTTLRGLVTGQEPLTCTFSHQDEDMLSSGTVYVAGGRMRGDYLTVAGDVERESHMIVNGNNSYYWNEGETQGVMMGWVQEEMGDSMEEEGETMEEEEVGGPFDADAQMDYQCDSWNADESMFALPSGVEFLNFNEMMMEEMGKGVEEGSMMGEDVMEQMEDVMEQGGSMMEGN